MNIETVKAPIVGNETPPGFLDEFRSCWVALSNKLFFFGLLIAWLALFHFIGNSTLGYINIPSLMGWMFHLYNIPNAEDGHGNLILPVVLIFFWLKRKELLASPQRTWWPGLIIVGGGLLFHVLGYLIQQPRVSIVGMFFGMYGLIGLTWGMAWLKATFFPFVLFVF